MVYQTLIILFTLLIQTSWAVEHTVLSEGYSKNDLVQSVINDKKKLIEYLDNNGIPFENINTVTDNVNTVFVLISPVKSEYPEQLKVSNIEKDKNGNYKVYYNIEYPVTVPDNVKAKPPRPYLLLQLSDPDIEGSQVSLINEKLKDVVVINNSISQDVKYSNILEDQENYLFVNYFPLDKGNSWTYNYIRNGKKGIAKYKITSFSQGWSVFDEFFGKYSVGFRIDGNGDLLVSTNQGMKPFYNDNVKITRENEPFKVGAGEFNQLLVVTIPRTGSFWFRDIYARGVGLIYHEQESAYGKMTYSLMEASVRGKKIPPGTSKN